MCLKYQQMVAGNIKTGLQGNATFFWLFQNTGRNIITGTG